MQEETQTPEETSPELPGRNPPSEIKDPEPIFPKNMKESDKVYQLISNKWAELGRELWNLRKYKERFEEREKALCYDADKLAIKHDKKLKEEQAAGKKEKENAN